MMSLKILPIMLAISLLASCGLTTRSPVKPPALSSDLAQDCAAPVTLKSPTMGAVASALLANTAALKDCAKRHHDTVAAWPS